MFPGRFFAKLAIYLGLLGLAQLFVGRYFLPSFPKKDDFDAAARTDREVLLFSDSINFSCAAADPQKWTIARHMQDLLHRSGAAPYTVRAVDHGGYQLEVYEEFLRYMISQHRRPPLVVISLNPRSFYPSWDLEPMYQFEREKTILAFDRPVLRSFCKPFLVFKGQSLLQSDKESVVNRLNYYWQRSNVPTDPSFAKIVLPTDPFYVPAALPRYFGSGFVTPAHRKMAALERICRLCHRRRIPVVFYVVGQNYDLTRDDLATVHTYRCNVDRLRACAERNESPCAVLTYSLPAEDFTDAEHLNEAGRRETARLLLPLVLAHLPGAPVSPGAPPPPPRPPGVRGPPGRLPRAPPPVYSK
jgi:hypothetical protein